MPKIRFSAGVPALAEAGRRSLTASMLALSLTACGDAVLPTAPAAGAPTAGPAEAAPPAAPAPAPAAPTAAEPQTPVAQVAQSEGCGTTTYSRRVPVSTAAELRDALATARAGDRIELADGVYQGQFGAKAGGTASERITLCGTSRAVLQGSSVQTGYGFLLEGSYWTLRGFTVTGSQFGVYLTGASHNVLDGLTVHRIGQEAVRFRSLSSHNVLQNSRIRDTGLHDAEYGEGVYIGSWQGHWAGNTGGKPDASDHNQVLNNVFGPDVRAEHIDAKEGTSGGIIRGNTFIGTGMVRSKEWVDSWVELKGNGYTVSGNTGNGTLRDGIQVQRELTGWGDGNVFSDNRFDLAGAAGVGFRIAAGTSGNTVHCNNSVLNAAGRANVSCQ